MTSKADEAPSSAEGQSVEGCREWRQGDVFTLRQIVVIGDAGDPSDVSAPQGVALVSQSCDAAQPSRSWVQVAPVVELGGDILKEACSGKRIDYAPLMGVTDCTFADLTQIVTVHKQALIGLQRQSGATGHQQALNFQGAVARKFGRFAFPDDVVRALRPLRDIIQSRSGKVNSPIGRVLGGLYTIRVGSTNGWDATQFHLRLDFIFEPGFLPFSDPADEFPDEPVGLRNRYVGSDGSLRKGGAALANAFEASDASEERFWLLNYLVESWTLACEDIATPDGADAVVQSVSSDLATIDDYPLSRVNETVDLDLDYLSEPLPRNPDLIV